MPFGCSELKEGQKELQHTRSDTPTCELFRIDEFQHTGGELILNDIYTFESGSNKVWKAVFFTGDTFHEVKKIISGQRIVFKTELFFKVNHNLGYNIFPEEIYEGHTD